MDDAGIASHSMGGKSLYRKRKYLSTFKISFIRTDIFEINCARYKRSVAISFDPNSFFIFAWKRQAGKANEKLLSSNG